MAKFNSLGSNFSLSLGWQVLTTKGIGAEKKLFTQVCRLAGHSQGKLQVSYFYKGREALLAALQAWHLPAASRVGVVGFTCVAVVQAVQKAGLCAVLLPIDKQTLNLDIKCLKKNLSVLIIQNTLGMPQPHIHQVIKFCKQNKIILIEDLAHSAGAIYDNGMVAGQIGSEVIYSSSQDKLLDTVSGGIWVSSSLGSKNFVLTKVPFCQQSKDRFYPLLTWLIRHGYAWGWGKCLHFLLKKMNLLSQPMLYQHQGELSLLPAWQRQFLSTQIKALPKELTRRRRLLLCYFKNLPAACLVWHLTPALLKRMAPLRLPIKVPINQKKAVIAALKQAGYFCSDTWYESPLAPENYYALLPRQQEINLELNQLARLKTFTAQLLNLPLHQEITRDDVRRISQIIQAILV